MINVKLPIDRTTLLSLHAFDQLLLEGELLVGRDQVHKRLSEALDNHQPLPIDLRGQAIYYMGPAQKGENLPIGSSGPTTSARMDRFTPALLAAGLVITIGKGPRSVEVEAALTKHQGLYLLAFGGCGALYATTVVSVEPVAYHDLGPEALLRMKVKDFPVIVGIDAHGNSVFR
ncbi:MAG: FumA C-terminus/TtdB family hydratase beta subunit [Sphaerochaetaceae bacterium]